MLPRMLFHDAADRLIFETSLLELSAAAAWREHGVMNSVQSTSRVWLNSELRNSTG